MKKLKAVLLGAGNRGTIYCDYALRRPDELEIVAVIDTNEFRAVEGAKRYGIAKENCFTSLDDFIEAKIECDFVVNGTTDRYHYETAMKVVGAGYNMILEKPITSSKQELMNIVNLAKEKNVKILVCHVLRYTPFYHSIKDIIDSGKLGKIMNMQLNEHVWYGHFVNSYVRGKSRNQAYSTSGLLIAKCCHDTDLICWLNNASAPSKVSSFGVKSFFTKENAPEGATQYCYECPHKETCMFNAYKFEIEKDFIPFYTWHGIDKPLNEITLEEKVEYLKHNVYGQCVFQTDMDIVDKQTVSVQFENGSLATLNVVGGTSKAGRHIHIICEYGEIVGYIEDNKYKLRVFDKDEIAYHEEEIDLDAINSIKNDDNSVIGHYGGDHYLMQEAMKYFNGVSHSVCVTDINDSINGHLVCYAAEESRLNSIIVDINKD